MKNKKDQFKMQQIFVVDLTSRRAQPCIILCNSYLNMVSNYIVFSIFEASSSCGGTLKMKGQGRCRSKLSIFGTERDDSCSDTSYTYYTLLLIMNNIRSASAKVRVLMSVQRVFVAITSEFQVRQNILPLACFPRG